MRDVSYGYGSMTGPDGIDWATLVAAQAAGATPQTLSPFAKTDLLGSLVGFPMTLSSLFFPQPLAHFAMVRMFSILKMWNMYLQSSRPQSFSPVRRRLWALLTYTSMSAL
jgi:hypothetical protein